jgi:hypothetical protein
MHKLIVTQNQTKVSCGKKSIPFAIAVLALTIGVFNATYWINSHASEEEGDEMPSKAIEDVLKEHVNDLMSISGVVGIGQGLCDEKSCIKVFLIKKTRELEEKIPKELEGYKVIIEETGKVRAYPQE